MVKLHVASSCSSRHEVVVANLRRRPFLDLYFVLFLVFSLYKLDPISAGSRVLLFSLLVFPKKCSFNH